MQVQENHRRPVKKDGPNKWRKFWSYALCPKGYGFFNFCEVLPDSAAKAPPRGSTVACLPAIE
jgi:hypothetical protein